MTLAGSLDKNLAGGLSEGAPGAIAPSRHIVSHDLRSLTSLHRLQRGHVLVAHETISRMVARIQPTRQDNVAVGDADAAIRSGRRRLKPRWRVIAPDDIPHTDGT